MLAIPPSVGNHKLLLTIHAGNPYKPRSPHDKAAIRANVLPAVGFGRGLRGTSRGVRAVPSNHGKERKFIPIELDFLNIIVQNPVKQFVGDLGRCIAPPILFRAGADKGVFFRNLLESLVVVYAPVAGVLHMEDRIGVIVAALMDEGR